MRPVMLRIPRPSSSVSASAGTVAGTAGDAAGQKDGDPSARLVAAESPAVPSSGALFCSPAQNTLALAPTFATPVRRSSAPFAMLALRPIAIINLLWVMLRPPIAMWVDDGLSHRAASQQRSRHDHQRKDCELHMAPPGFFVQATRKL